MNTNYDVFFSTSLADQLTYSGSLHYGIIVDAQELRDILGVEVSTNGLSFFIKDDLYDMLAKNSKVTYNSKNYIVKNKISDHYDNRIIEITEDR